ncbi:MAG TPA: hypothetical protein VJ732_10205 [Bryobacteraceae bacterium]|nr:hypothetical protein [Bryobacteraceae bacterium]
MEPASIIGWKRRVFAILLFAVAFGYLEAAVVSYLRVLHEPARQRFYPGRPASELFPLLTLQQARETQQTGVLAIEVGREAATIVMLAALALAVSANTGQWFAAFVMAFGAWDLMFYIFLKVLLGWPASLMTWDVLFLIPVPWAAPVLAPSIVAALMVIAGFWHLRREARGAPVRIGGRHWAGIVLGGAILIVSFTMDYPNLMAGGRPHPFHWGVFLLGAAAGVFSYVRAAVGSARKEAATRAAV